MAKAAVEPLSQCPSFPLTPICIRSHVGLSVYTEPSVLSSHITAVVEHSLLDIRQLTRARRIKRRMRGNFIVITLSGRALPHVCARKRQWLRAHASQRLFEMPATFVVTFNGALNRNDAHMVVRLSRTNGRHAPNGLRSHNGAGYDVHIGACFDQGNYLLRPF